MYHTVPRTAEDKCASFLFALADYRAVFAALSPPRGPWALGALCPGLGAKASCWFPCSPLLPSGMWPFLGGGWWGSGEILLSGLDLEKQAVWAFWLSLDLSCSGLPTQIKEVFEEAGSSTAVRLEP